METVVERGATEQLEEPNETIHYQCPRLVILSALVGMLASQLAESEGRPA